MHFRTKASVCQLIDPVEIARTTDATEITISIHIILLVSGNLPPAGRVDQITDAVRLSAISLHFSCMRLLSLPLGQDYDLPRSFRRIIGLGSG
jgi:hypothetical protein